jgi:hypothetical protein
MWECVSGSEKAVGASVLSPRPTFIQSYLVSVKVMTTGPRRKKEHKEKPLCGGNSWLWTEQMWQSRKSGHTEYWRGHLPWIRQCWVDRTGSLQHAKFGELHITNTVICLLDLYLNYVSSNELNFHFMPPTFLLLWCHLHTQHYAST